jgi:hydroxylamine reductase (hybrid-cluster protein)
VNGSYKGDDAIGKLVHDFRCSNADDMYYSQFADGVRYYKESEGGKEKMCEKVERYAEKKAEERAEERVAERVREAEKKAEKNRAVMVKNLMKNMNLTINQAFDVLEVSETDRKAIADLI